MDRLTAFVAIAHMRMRLDYYQRNLHLLETDGDMTPKLQGALHTLSMLKHRAETFADHIVKRAGSADGRLDAVEPRVEKALDSMHADMGDIEKFVTGLEGHNAPPLDDSSESSEASQPEHLTINGVTQG